MKKAIYLAAEAWRRKYGQLKTQRLDDPGNIVSYTLPSGETCTLQGWRATQRDGEAVYISPDGAEFTTLQFASEAQRTEREGAVGSSGATLRALTKVLHDFKEGHYEDSDHEPAPADAAQDNSGGQQGHAPKRRRLRCKQPAASADPPEPAIAPAAEAAAAAEVEKVPASRTMTLSQLDDWLHRGDHPIVKDMNLYVYSLWVYRVELPSWRVGGKVVDVSSGRHVDIPFDSSYAAARTWVQRLAEEPRLPNVQGFQFVAATPEAAEMHHLLKSTLLRPAYLPPPDEEIYTRELRYLKAYEAYCTAPAGEADWAAQRVSEAAPGPFQRGWESFFADQQKIASSARHKCFMTGSCAWSYPSVWNTREVADALRERIDAAAARDSTEAPDESTSAHYPYHKLLSAAEYCALETVRTAANFDGLAIARSKKPPRKIDVDQQVPEQQPPVYWEGGQQDGEGDAQLEGAELRARQGLASLGENAIIAHRFEPELLDKILKFETAERTQSFVKQLQETPLMAAGELPAPQESTALQRRRTQLRESLLEPLRGLCTLGRDVLRELVDVQRKRFARAGSREEDVPDDDAPLEIDEAAPHEPQAAPEPVAYFAPSDQYRRPSDYVAELARQFEAGKWDEKTGRIEPKPLKRDQALFVAQFAAACNAVWDDEERVKDGTLPVKKRRCFNLLLMGAGGSGKTALVQDIVLPAMSFLFPTENESSSSSTLIVCAKWSQAENISTEQHKAITCHRAGLVGIQSFENKAMPAGDKRPALTRVWGPLRCLILEEVSMISPQLYNMLLFRSFLGRAEQWGVEEQQYDEMSGAFGRMPIVIHLGDFLQLKPTGSGTSLIADFEELAERGFNLAVEFQSVMKLFCRTPLCFELQATNRFKEPRLRALMEFMRAPAKRLPPAIKADWDSICLKADDPRLRAERFQNGHMTSS
jgi:hypothetical protein